MALLDQAELRALIERLASIRRPSASAGERAGAEVIAAEMRGAGARVRLEEEVVHGTYWWPIGLLTGVSALAGASARRVVAALAGALAGAAVADDISGGTLLFRRRFLPTRTTTNVVAEMGAEEAERTVLLVAHHDAARSGLVFHPEIPRAVLRRFPRLLERSDTTPGVLWGAVAGPVLVALGALLGLRAARAAGTFLCAGYAAAMADIGSRQVVPGANDNLSGVATLVSLGRSLRDDPLPGLRVVLLFSGSEESFMEGMQAFARRHFASLPRDRTTVICVDTVGSPHLLVLEGEGMLWMNEYPKDLIALFHDCARDLGIYIYPNLRLRNATDGLIALRAGYRTAMVGSVDDFKCPSNYHWPSDTPDNLDYGSVANAARLTRAVVERLAGGR